MASTELTTNQNAAPPNNASSGTRKEVSTSPELLSLEILFICTNFRGAELHEASNVRDSHSSSPRICLSGFVHGHSKALGFSGALGAGAVAFSTRAAKFDRAAAGFCHSRSVICITMEIGRRTRPRFSSIQPEWFSAWFSGGANFGQGFDAHGAAVGVNGRNRCGKFHYCNDHGKTKNTR